MATPKMVDNQFGWDPVDPFDEKDTNFWVKIEHLGRYLFSSDYLRPFKPNCVADIACGMGYGLVELNSIAKSVLGVDSSQEVLDEAEKWVKNSKIRLLKCDLDNENLIEILGESSVDAIISFETLEHLLNPSEAVSQFSRLLISQGILICSVPNVLFEGRDDAGLPSNKYHKQFFNFNSLYQMLKQNGFQIVYRLGQSWSNILFKRESQLLRKKAIQRRLGEIECMNSPEVIRYFSNVFAYPTVEDVDGSYSIIVVAQKNP